MPHTVPRLVVALVAGALLLSGCAAVGISSERGAGLQVFVLRLHPGDDLKRSLDTWVRTHGARAAVVLTAVGSLGVTTIRLADAKSPTVLEGKREIVSLVGMLSSDSGSHLHLAASDSSGATTGGHLLEGSAVYTTVEIALGVLEGVRFVREVDPTYGYHELVVQPDP